MLRGDEWIDAIGENEDRKLYVSSVVQDLNSFLRSGFRQPFRLYVSWLVNRVCQLLALYNDEIKQFLAYEDDMFEVWDCIMLRPDGRHWVFMVDSFIEFIHLRFSIHLSEFLSERTLEDVERLVYDDCANSFLQS